MNQIPIIFIIFGIAMIVCGGYILITKDIFGKREFGEMLSASLNLSAKARGSRHDEIY